jgi:putative restriction endonuclease
VFLVKQSGRLQCLNGAYFSEFPDELSRIILGTGFQAPAANGRSPLIDARTAEHVAMINAKVGQQHFSNMVRDNYNGACCFPDCDVAQPELLVGSHIARWADAPDLRGQASNGLCFCLLHDRAFELGLFTLTVDCAVSVNRSRGQPSTWVEAHIAPFDSRRVRGARVPPSAIALQHHWMRIGYSPAHVGLS